MPSAIFHKTHVKTKVLYIIAHLCIFLCSRLADLLRVLIGRVLLMMWPNDRGWAACRVRSFAETDSDGLPQVIGTNRVLCCHVNIITRAATGGIALGDLVTKCARTAPYHRWMCLLWGRAVCRDSTADSQ